MKTTRTLFVMALFAASLGTAQQTTTDPSLQVYETPKFLPVVAPKAPKNEAKHINGLSTRSWTTVVGWRPGSSAFPDERTHEAGLYLFSVGATPGQ